MRWTLFLVLLVVGCGSKFKPVNVATAQNALMTTMECWKEGKSPADLQEEDPPITVEELEWSRGAKLLEYDMVGEDKSVDESLVAQVKIKLEMVDGKVVEKTATYIVNTRPEVTVFRNMLR